MKFLLLLISIFPFWLSAQDSLVFINELSWSHEREKSNFYNLESDQTLAFDLFYELEDTAQSGFHKRSFYTFIDQLAQAKRPKKNEKWLKFIHEEIHDKFFRKYVVNIRFDQIFSIGHYNCVTACAIYALAFERLGITYEIKETPTHVYMVAFPAEEQILIETTDPLSGFKTFSPGFKENFVMQLASMKLIDQVDQGKGVTAIFDEYYFNRAGLLVNELVGIHFYNHGVHFFNEKQYDKALVNLEKAYYLHPNEQMANMLFASMVSVISESDYSDLNHIKLLARLARFEEYNVGSQEIIGEFNRFLNLHLINRNDTAYVAEGMRIMEAELQGVDYYEDISFLYNYERARINFNRGNYKESYIFCEQAYDAKPTNIDAETLIVSSLAMYIDNSNDYDFALSRMNALREKFPSIMKNNKVGGILLHIYLLRMGEAFDNRNETDAKEYKSAFINLTEQYPNYRANEYEIGRAFSKGVSYYFKKGWMKSAKALVNEGLQFAPDNQELRTRLYMINRG